jgi:peptidoglycan hydrolase-like protein with peptidoglycan-binding domain
MTVALFASGVLIAQDTSGVKPKSTASKKSAARRRKPAAAASAKPAATTSATKTVAHRRSSTSKSAKSKKPVAAATHRSTQQQPTPERYKEIQQALAEHGYFNGSVDGAWGADSVDALKRFQRDQNLTDDGKIGSLSLIALGLGPKRVDAPAEKSSQQ